MESYPLQLFRQAGKASLPIFQTHLGSYNHVSLEVEQLAAGSWSHVWLHAVCRYVSTGNAVVVVHTLANEGGELGAWLPTSKAMGPMAGMRMGGEMGPIVSVSAPAPANSMGGTSMASGQSMHG